MTVRAIIILTSVFLCQKAYLQSEPTPSSIKIPKHELKINGLFLILGALEVDYQYLLNEEAAIGADVLVAFDDDELDINYAITPYYRQYFGKKYATGFFAEGFAMLNSTNDYVYTESHDPNTNSYFYGGGYEKDIVDFALGLGVGVKFMTRRGFVFEIEAGIGRNLFKGNRDYKIIGKGGINVGYRF